MNIHQIEKHLRKLFPYGHEGFIPMQIQKMKLHSDKNFKYAFGGRPLGNFDRVAKIMALYPTMNWARPECVALLYSLKQLDASLYMLEKGHGAKAIEGIDECLADDSVYKDIARLARLEHG